MKVIIAGPHTLGPAPGLVPLVSCAVRASRFTLSRVLSGHAPSIDQAAEIYAANQTPPIPVDLYPALWSKYGRKAGPIRNEEMATDGDALIALWDGESYGTRSMIQFAERYRLLICIYSFRLTPRQVRIYRGKGNPTPYRYPWSEEHEAAERSRWDPNENDDIPF